MDRRRRRVLAAVFAAVVGILSVGCGASDDAAMERAEHFYSALASGDGAAACADLAREARSSLEQQEGKPCEDVVLDQELPDVRGSASAKVYGSMAQVAFSTETTFLSRFDDGWRLTAVGCKHRGVNAAYDCTIEVG